jgi:DNA-binding transcriptional ArsR family regulator
VASVLVHNIGSQFPGLFMISEQDAPVAIIISRSEREAGLLFKVLSDPIRLAILRVLAEEEGSFVGQICDRLEITPTAMSHHLQVLRSCGLVEPRREGSKAFYSIVGGLDGVIDRTTLALNELRQPAAKASKAKRTV